MWDLRPVQDPDGSLTDRRTVQPDSSAGPELLPARERLLVSAERLQGLERSGRSTMDHVTHLARPLSASEPALRRPIPSTFPAPQPIGDATPNR